MAWMVFGNNRRRRYDGGYAGRGYGARGYGPRPGGGCARDACLLEGGCCLAESLNGNCLMLLLLSLPQLALLLLGPSSVVPREQTRAQACLLVLVRRYQQRISARRVYAVCRFSPSCSAYAVQAVTGHGAVRGTLLTGRRILRCRPGAAGGYDPAPQRSPEKMQWS